jgi:hypothetical protein
LSYPYPLDAAGRLAEADQAIDDTRTLIRSWIAGRTAGGGEPARVFGRFGRHFTTLQGVLEQMLDAIAGSLHEPPAPDGALAYERSRTAERRVGKVRATFRWYAAKYEQREAAGADGYGRVLLAADEMVRSCFDTAFARADRPRPPDPLCYLDESFDATATPRVQPPRGIPAGDEVVGEFVRKLPVPVIALPVTCLEKPWWLAVAAHEVGHHVYFDLDPGLEQATEARVSDAAGAARDEDVTEAWRRWSTEAFADMWSVLMVGGSAGWMVAQLSAAEPGRLVTLAGSTSLYPPPLVRLALFGELARLLEVEPPGPSAAEIISLLGSPGYEAADRLSRDEHLRHLSVVPGIAGALLDVESGGRAMPDLSGFDGGLLRGGGRADSWSQQLFNDIPALTPVDRAWSARTLVAAAAQHAADIPAGATDRPQREAKLCAYLLETLPRTGPEGDLAEVRQPSAAGAAGLAGDLVGLLFEEVQ